MVELVEFYCSTLEFSIEAAFLYVYQILSSLELRIVNVLFFASSRSMLVVFFCRNELLSTEQVSLERRVVAF